MHTENAFEHRDLVQAAAQLSEPSLAAVWDNPDDDVYNDLSPAQLTEAARRASA
jgi:hypothetical protein